MSLNLDRQLKWLKGMDLYRAGSVVGISTLLAACSSTPVPRYYTLTPTVTPLSTTPIKVIEVLPVGLPDRLDRSQIVLQDAAGQSKMLDQERWSSTLSSELRDGLSSGLQQRLGAVDRYSSGMAGGSVSYRIAVDFSRFDIVQENSASKNNVLVGVAWIIRRNDPSPIPVNQPKVLPDPYRQLSCRMTFSTPIDGTTKPSIAQIVASSRQSLTHVVNTVAASVVSLENTVKSGTSIQIDEAACS